MATYTFSKQKPPEWKLFIRTHKPGCKYPETQARKDCGCTKHFEITPGFHSFSAHTGNWGLAEKRAQAWCDDHDPNKTKVVSHTDMSIAEVFVSFIAAGIAANLETSTLRHIRSLGNKLAKWVEGWNATHNAAQQLKFIADLKLNHVNLFVQSWDANLKPRKVHTRECERKPGCGCREVKEQMSQTHKKHLVEYLVRVFGHALQNGWIANTGETVPKGKQMLAKDNPALFVDVTGKKRQAENKMPLTDKTWQALLVAIRQLCEARKSYHIDPNLAVRGTTFFSLMYEAGFSITDTMILKWSDLKHDEDGYFFNFKRKKTGKSVLIHITDAMYEALRTLPAGLQGANPEYVFWCGPDYEKAAGSERKIREQECKAASEFDKLFREAVTLIPVALLQQELDKHRDEHGDIILPTPHCLRYSFADNFLKMGGTMEQLAIALGDTIEVVQLHYAKLTAGRQKQATNVIKQMHQKMGQKVLAQIIEREQAATQQQPVYVEVGVVGQA